VLAQHQILPLPRRHRVAYGDGVGRLRDALGIRLVDVAAAAAVAVAVELNVYTGGGNGARPLNAVAYAFGAMLAVPVLFRRKWPLRVLIACSVLLLLLYELDRRNISPAPSLSLPLYDAALAGYLTPAIVIPTVYMVIGLFVVEYSTNESLAVLSSDFLLPAAVMALAIMLGDALRSRRALAAETADKLRLAAEERDAESARAVAEERLRIARDLHDTVAHSMATITVQAGSALHLIGGTPAGARPAAAGSARPAKGASAGTATAASAGTATAGSAGIATAASTGTATAAGQPDAADGATAVGVRAALVAIRETSRGALADMRHTLGQLRVGDADPDAPEAMAGGLDRLDALSDAVRAAGAPVTVTIEGEPMPLPPAVDHAAYRILQESLTNVLRHAGSDASATVRLSYAPGALTIQVTDDGTGPAARLGAARLDETGQPAARGHGLTGMTERAAAIGGRLSARPGPDGGFEVVARLPVTQAGGPR
jgi:signal transduction histidine kinase